MPALSRDLVSKAAELAGWVLVLFATYAIALQAGTPAPPPPIVSFDDPATTGFWEAANGREFPGATARAVGADGLTGRGQGVAYSFDCSPRGCGRYVALIWTPPAPLLLHDGDRVAIEVKAGAGMRVGLRVQDRDGETFQSGGRDIVPDFWTRLEFPLDFQTMEKWGGDGTYSPPMTSLSVVFGPDEPERRAPLTGLALIDDLAFLRSADASQTSRTPAPPASLPANSR